MSSGERFHQASGLGMKRSREVTTRPYMAAGGLGDRKYTSGNLRQPNLNKVTGLPNERFSKRESAIERGHLYVQQDDVDPSQEYLVPNRDYADSILDPTDANTQIIITEITDSEQWLINRLMPWMLANGSLSVEWNEWIFDDSQLTNTPEESVSRFATNHKRKHVQAIKRLGHSIKMETNHLYTREGILEWGYKLRQIYNALVEGACMETLEALIEAEYEPTDSGYDYIGWDSNEDTGSMYSKFRTECDFFGIVNKGPTDANGLTELHSRMSKRFQARNGYYADTFIHANGVADYWNCLKRQEPYSTTGVRPDNIDRSLHLPDNAMCYESRPFRLPRAKEAPGIDGDPLVSKRYIGNYFRMNDAHLNNVPVSEFKLSMLDTEIINEPACSYYTWSYQDQFSSLGLYMDWKNGFDITSTDNHPYLSEIGQSYHNFHKQAQTYKEVYEALGPKYWNNLLEAVCQKEGCIEDLITIAGIPFNPNTSHFDDSSALMRAYKEHSVSWFAMDDIGMQSVKDTISVQSRARGGGPRFNRKNPYERPGMGAGGGRGYRQQEEEEEDVEEPQEDMIDQDEPEEYEELHSNDPMKVLQQLGSKYEHMNEQYLKELLILLSQLDKETKNTKGYLNLGYRQAQKLLNDSDQGDTIGLQVWQSILPILLNDELETCLESTKGNKTVLEKHLSSSEHDNLFLHPHDLDESILRADAHSYRWLSGKEKSNPEILRLYSDPWYSVHQDVPYASLATTLTSQRLCIFDITDEALEKLIGNNGIMDFDDRGIDPDLDPSLKHPARVSALQYSVTLSAILSTIRRYNTESEGVSEEEKEALKDKYVGGISYLLQCPKPVRGDRRVYLNDVSKITQFPLLSIQMELSSIVEPINKMVYHCLRNPDTDMILRTLIATSSHLNDPTFHIQKAIEERRNKNNRNANTGSQGSKNLFDEEELARLNADLNQMGGIRQLTNDDWMVYRLVNVPSNNLSMEKLFNRYRLCNLLYASAYGKVIPKASGTDITLMLLSKEIWEHQTMTDANVLGWIDNLLSRAAVSPANNPLYAEVSTQLLVGIEKRKIAEAEFEDIRGKVQAYNPANRSVAVAAPRTSINPTPDVSDESASAWAKQLMNPDKKKRAREIIAHYFQHLPVEDGRPLQVLMNHDVMPPYGFMNMRPSCGYEMGMCLAVKSKSVGRNWFHTPCFKVGEDSRTQVTLGSFTIYVKAVVTKPQDVLRVYDVWCKRYIEGNGVVPIDYNNQEFVDNYRSNQTGDNTPDVFPTPRPINFNCWSQPVDVTGNYQNVLNPTSQEVLGCEYGGMDVINQKMGWQHSHISPLDRSYESYIARSDYMNTICFQDHQMLWNHTTGNYNKAIAANGHWGSDIGPQSCKIRNGYCALPYRYNFDQQQTIVVRR